MLDEKYTYAVIGASNNPAKYGHQVLKDLLNNGYKAIPINPKEKIILGQKAYSNLSGLKQKIDVAIFVVPPKITEKILKTIKNYNITKVWLQPGSESETAVKFCQANNINCIHNACIMLEKKYASI